MSSSLQPLLILPVSQKEMQFLQLLLTTLHTKHKLVKSSILFVTLTEQIQSKTPKLNKYPIGSKCGFWSITPSLVTDLKTILKDISDLPGFTYVKYLNI